MIGIVFLFSLIMFLVPIGVAVFTVIALWNVFKKAGKEGWEAIVPVYNNIVLLEITGLPMWYIALLFVPVGNIYAMVMIYLELAKKFKQTTGFAIGLIFLAPIFLGILAFKKEITYDPSINTNVFCTNCGTKVSSSDKFCPGCGSKVEKVKDICLNCGHKIKKDDKFCMGCGNKI